MTYQSKCLDRKTTIEKRRRQNKRLYRKRTTIGTKESRIHQNPMSGQKTNKKGTKIKSNKATTMEIVKHETRLDRNTTQTPGNIVRLTLFRCRSALPRQCRRLAASPWRRPDYRELPPVEPRPGVSSSSFEVSNRRTETKIK